MPTPKKKLLSSGTKSSGGKSLIKKPKVDDEFDYNAESIISTLPLELPLQKYLEGWSMKLKGALQPIKITTMHTYFGELEISARGLHGLTIQFEISPQEDQSIDFKYLFSTPRDFTIYLQDRSRTSVKVYDVEGAKLVQRVKMPGHPDTVVISLLADQTRRLKDEFV